MSDPEDYHVGWICAIPTEYAAAKCFLNDGEKPHPPPKRRSLNDNNNYTLGRMGEHNVVIAVMPKGEYGTTSAASVARDMVHSFPNVRIGLMVGIGGGAPSKKNNIRLGDVVISTPTGGMGGVLQYDFGKAIQDKTFQMTGHLNQPPPSLLTALSGLEAQYLTEGYDIKGTIHEKLDLPARKMMRKSFRRPDSSTDRLYLSHVVHKEISPTSSCAESCGDDKSVLQSRDIREDDDVDPVVHYGLIASANQVMKDATARDKLAAEKNVLCFEMEAAGLMNHFPCLVIRGICDYSDSHKSKEWQGYAAMTAAAVARDLLDQVAPGSVAKEKKISEVLAEVNEKVSKIEEGVSKITQKQRESERTAVLEWISPDDYGRQQADYLKRWQRGTGQWLLESDEFKNWLAGRGQTLFRWGMPGAGKTTLTSIVVDHISRQEPAAIVAYVYCNFQHQDHQSVEDLMSAVLKQLCLSLPVLPDCVLDLHEKCTRHARVPATVDEISACLASVVASDSHRQVFVVVDALDECLSADGRRRDFMTRLFQLRDQHGVNLFVTSRPEPDIKKAFSPAVSAEIRAHETDVVCYLNGHATQLPEFMASIPGLVDKVKQEIAAVVGGMFLLAKLYLDFIATRHNESEVLLALRKLAKAATDPSDGPSAAECSAERVYADLMQRIEDADINTRNFAKRVLAWIVCARRPLTARELRHALAVDKRDRDPKPSRLSPIEVIVSACASLVVADEEGDIVRLVHPTAYDYLSRTVGTWAPSAHADLATICVTYLSFHAFDRNPCSSDVEFEDRLRRYPFYQYAARNWAHHVRNALTLPDGVVDFLKQESQVRAASQALFADPRSRWPDYSQDIPQKMTGLHLAACGGAALAVAELLQTVASADLADSYGRTPLSWAAACGYDDVVKLLLNSGKANPSWLSHGNRTPLSLAAASGCEGTVKVLLSHHDVNVEAADEMERVPLAWAARGGHEAVVRLLLEAWTPTGEDLMIPLQDAIESGNEAVVELLVSVAEADPDWAEGCMYGERVLHEAAEKGDVAIVRRILRSGAIDIDAQNENGRTPLMIAAERGHGDVVEMLLRMPKLRPQFRDRQLRTALSRAAQNGEEDIVNLLLENRKVEVDSPDEDDRTPLFWAAMNGHEEVVASLLKTGKVKVDGTDRNRQTPLFYAAKNGHVEVARRLLEHKTTKVCVDAKNVFGQTPLSVALDNEDQSMVELLREFNALDVEPEAQKQPWETANVASFLLQFAAS